MKNSKAKLDFTGERLIPEINKGESFYYEHLARYLFASSFVKGKRVLDAGCGSGYGSNILASYGGAAKVTAVDQSSEAINYASDKYKRSNIEFIVSDILKLDISKDKAEVITAFEIIEHLKEYSLFLEVLKSSLKPNGLLIVSTPNKNASTQDNPYHTQEFTPEQFVNLLKKYFKFVNIFYQGYEFSQVIKSNEKIDFKLEEDYIKLQQDVYGPKANTKNSQYLVAVCSNTKNQLQTKTVSVNTDRVDSYDLTQGLVSLEKQFSTLHKFIESLNERNKRTEFELDSVRGELDYIKYSKFFILWPYYIKVRDVFRSFASFIFKLKLIANLNSNFDAYQKWFAINYPSKKKLLQQQKEAEGFKLKPKISIITPTFNTPERFLRDCIESVQNQSYQNFELCIADDASTDPKVREIIREYAHKDKRIKYIFRKENGHISQASNSALEIATGGYIGLLDHDDILWPNALFELVKALNNHPKAEFFYSDEDKLDEDGRTHVNPFFKPDWSPDYLRSINYITHFSVLKRSLVNKINGFRVGFEGSQDLDLFLRATNQIDDSSKIIHIPTILYSWRKSPFSTASEKNGLSVKSYAYRNQQKSLVEDLKLRGYVGNVVQTKNLGSWRVRYDIIGNPLVSIIIPTKNQFRNISNCLNSIIQKSTYRNFELIILDTGSTESGVRDFYDLIKKKHPKTQIINWTNEFNFSSVSNFGAEKAKGEYLVFLNNDTEVITPDWIESLLEHAQRKEVGAVGAKLLYPDKKIQHLGGVLGVCTNKEKKGFAGHAYKYIPSETFINFDSYAIKNYSFVTAACLMVSKKKFKEVGGFDEKFKIAFNDIDLCLKLYKDKKYFNLINPNAELFHKESATIQTIDKKERDTNLWRNETLFFHNKWGEVVSKDPFYNPHLTKDKEDFSVGV
ncbi:MAG: glycosyltransferase [Candidatus Daviesbacteria bacterium]|nr:glycosyltransferase [Candidatus Daviesbacteria bacterium]